MGFSVGARQPERQIQFGEGVEIALALLDTTGAMASWADTGLVANTFYEYADVGADGTIAIAGRTMNG